MKESEFDAKLNTLAKLTKDACLLSFRSFPPLAYLAGIWYKVRTVAQTPVNVGL